MSNIEHITNEISRLVPVMIRHMYPFVFQPLELPPSQVIALSILQEKGRCRMGELSKEMHNTAPTTSGIIDRLEKSGHVKRLQDEHDRRATNIVITNRGVKVVTHFQSNIRQRWEFILSKLPESEGEEVLKVLRRITKGFVDGTIS